MARGPKVKGECRLCGSCNSRTGGWYGRAFAELTDQVMSLLEAAPDRSSIRATYRIYPLRVLKQIACMFFSVNGPRFREAHPELVKFVLDKEAVGLPDRYRLFGYINPTIRSRTAGVSAVIEENFSRVHIISEISFFPLGYVICFSPEPLNDRLVDLTFMASYRYHELKELTVELPVFRPWMPNPLDFRDRETVMRDSLESIEDPWR